MYTHTHTHTSQIKHYRKAQHISYGMVKGFRLNGWHGICSLCIDTTPHWKIWDPLSFRTTTTVYRMLAAECIGYKSRLYTLPWTVGYERNQKMSWMSDSVCGLCGVMWPGAALGCEVKSKNAARPMRDTEIWTVKSKMCLLSSLVNGSPPPTCRGRLPSDVMHMCGRLSRLTVDFKGGSLKKLAFDTWAWPMQMTYCTYQHICKHCCQQAKWIGLATMTTAAWKKQQQKKQPFQK